MSPLREKENDITWRVCRNVCRSDHEMLISGIPVGIWIMAAQHPTALRPYYVSDGGAVSLRKYGLLVDAKTAALTVLAERFEAVP